MAEIRGIDYLRHLCAQKQLNNRRRYDYYEMKSFPTDIPLFDCRTQYHKSALGWCTRAVDALADRLVFKGWKNDNFNLSQIFELNNPDIFFDSAIVSALITGCAFVWISLDEENFPRLEVIDGRNATGVIDPVTNLLEEGYAILEQDERGPLLEAYFEPYRTTFYRRGLKPYAVENEVAYPLLVPIIFKPDAKRKLGHSRISRSCMDLMSAAIRTLRRSELTAELYSYPQRYILGTDPEAEEVDKVKASVSAVLELTKDQDGDKPTVGQFSQQSMQPYMDQLRTLAALFAGETGLTLDDLGFVSDNPSSAEAIKASHETLRLTARKAQRTFGACFLNVGYIAACLRDEEPYRRKQFYLTEPQWMPIFEPDSAMLSSIGDGAIKINQAVPGYFNTNNLEDLTGVSASELEPVNVDQ